jgi:hypothetical protein
LYESPPLPELASSQGSLAGDLRECSGILFSAFCKSSVQNLYKTLSCSAEVVHRTRRIATVGARVRDRDGYLVAMGTGTFRIFEKRGDPIV